MTRRYASAGAVVTTDDLNAPSVLLLDQVRKTGERQTVAPKGRLEPGEAPLQAARREVAEEAGLTDTRYSAYLGQEAYSFTDNDGEPATKSVDWFLFTTEKTTTTPARAEGFLKARWLDARAAQQAASHEQFRQILNRALAIVAWRSAGPLPFSRELSDLVIQVATEAQAAVAGHPAAGVGLCGSAARGDFVNGWSDVDFVAWNLPPTSLAAAELDRIVAESSLRHRQSTSLHFVDDSGRDVRRLSALSEMKMRAAMARVGLDTAVIAGVGPLPATQQATAGFVTDISLLHQFAVDLLCRGGDSDAEREEASRRTLSAFSNAARLLVTRREPGAPLRLSEVQVALADWPGTQLTDLLRDYDGYRRSGAEDRCQAVRLAARVPAALAELRQLLDGQTVGQTDP